MAGALIFRCRETGRAIETSVNTDEQNLSVFRTGDICMRCPICGGTHRWHVKPRPRLMTRRQAASSEFESRSEADASARDRPRLVAADRAFQARLRLYHTSEIRLAAAADEGAGPQRSFRDPD